MADREFYGSDTKKLQRYWNVQQKCPVIEKLKIDLEKIDNLEIDEIRTKLKEHSLLAAGVSRYLPRTNIKYKIDASRFEADFNIQLKKNKTLVDIAAYGYKHLDEKHRDKMHKLAERNSDDHMKGELRNCALLEVKDQANNELRQMLAESKAETKLALESKKVYIQKRPRPTEEPPKKRRRVDVSFDVKEPDHLMNLTDFLAECKVVAKASAPRNRIKRAKLLTDKYFPRAIAFKKILDAAVNKPGQPWTVSGRGKKKRLPQCRGKDKPKYKLMATFIRTSKKTFNDSQSLWCKGEHITKRLISFMRKTQGQPLVHEFLKTHTAKEMMNFNKESKKLKCKKKIAALLQKHTTTK